MSIYEPKIIDLGDFVAITGENQLIFATKREFKENVQSIITEVEKSFSNQDYDGLCCRADPKTLSITFIPTTRCNLKCIYCYSDGGNENLDLSFEECRYVIDQLLEKYPEIEKMNLSFTGGGESLLNFTLIEKITNYIKQLNLSTFISIVTNGTLISQYIDWLRENHVNLRISYDGSTQSFTRPGKNFDSMVKVKEIFEKLKNEYDSDLLSVQMTTTKYNLDTMPQDVITLINEYKINSIKIEPVQASCSTRSKTVDYPEPEIFAYKLIETLDNLIEKNIKAYIDTSFISVPNTAYFCSLRKSPSKLCYQS